MGSEQTSFGSGPFLVGHRSTLSSHYHPSHVTHSVRSAPATADNVKNRSARAFLWVSADPSSLTLLSVLSARIMTDSLTSPRYTGLSSVVRAIWVEAGWKGFYRGFVPVVLRAFPTKCVPAYLNASLLGSCLPSHAKI